MTDTERETLDGVAGYRNAQAVHRAVEAIVTPYADALAEARGDNPSGFWSQREWEDWSNTLSELIPEGEEASYSNPEGAQEAIIEDCFRAYKTERDAALAALARVEALADELHDELLDDGPGPAEDPWDKGWNAATRQIRERITVALAGHGAGRGGQVSERGVENDAAVNELRLAALGHAIKCYAGPADDTIPVLVNWLRAMERGPRGLHACLGCGLELDGEDPNDRCDECPIPSGSGDQS